jgi:hypothetical protein
MDLLLVAPRARHLDFPLGGIEACFDRTQAPDLWIATGIRRWIVKWFEGGDCRGTGPAVARGLGARAKRPPAWRLVGIGVAEAHELELRVQAASAEALSDIEQRSSHVIQTIWVGTSNAESRAITWRLWRHDTREQTAAFRIISRSFDDGIGARRRRRAL